MSVIGERAGFYKRFGLAGLSSAEWRKINWDD